MDRGDRRLHLQGMTMSEQLLLEATAVNGLEAAVGCLDDLRKVFVERTAGLVSLVLESAEKCSAAWPVCVKAVAAGETGRIHALRDVLYTGLLHRLEALRHATRLAGMAAALEGREVSGADRLSAATADLERLRVRVFERWRTAEDLEDLVAADYPLSGAQLEALAAKYPPPPSWYQEEDMTFAPAD
jgi:hypothetical protein